MEKYQTMKAISSKGLSRLKNSVMNFTALQPSYIVPQAVHMTEMSANPTLNEMLLKYELKLVPVTGDGNCFLSAIALNMLTDVNHWAYNDEFVGDRRSKYEEFVEVGKFDYETEANKFRSDGFYDSELGNTMPLALCTALQCCIILFSRDHHTRNKYITPNVLGSEAVCFLVYSPNGPGHYDYAIPLHTSSSTRTSDASLTHSTTCSCGVNPKIVSCKPSAVYATRCRFSKNLDHAHHYVDVLTAETPLEQSLNLHL